MPQLETSRDILVVDANSEDLRTIETLLKEHGYKVRCIRDAKMAIKVAAGEPPEMMLLAVNMPKINGCDVCRTIKACPETRGFPILFLTTLTERENLAEVFDAGGADHITKPFQKQEVLARVKTHLTIDKTQYELKGLKRETDITEKKYTEDERDRILSISRDLICIAGEDGYFKYLNPSWEKKIGYTIEEMLSRPFLDFIHPDDHVKNDVEVDSLVKGNDTLDFENRYIHKNGSIVSISWIATKVPEENTFYCIGRDITERKHLEEQLFKHREHLETIVKERTAELKERVKELNCLYGLSKIIEIPDISIEEIFAKTVNLIPPSWQYPAITCGGIFYKTKEYKTENFKKNKWKQSAKIIVSGKTEGTIEVYYLEEKPQIHEGPFLKEERALIDALAERLGKVTERKLAEKKLLQNQATLKKAQEKAEGANRLKSQFLANMSHDIRTPLNAVIGFTDLLTKSDMPNESGRYLNKIKNAGEGLLNLINDILDFSKIEAGQLDIFQRTFRVKVFLKGLRDIFELQFQQKGVELETRLSPNVPEAVYNDKWRINQVLTNLLTNALKFTAKGNVTLCTGYHEEQDLLVFKVTDTGDGIAPQNQDRIFEPFIQIDDIPSYTEKGAGLGLAICNKLVRLIGGTISVSSTYGEGSEFTVEIAANSLKVEAQTVTDAQLEIVETDLDPKKGNTILIVDDNVVNMELLIEQFKVAGFTNLLSAENGKQAVEQALEHSPDLILMDTQMPVMNGNQAIAQLKKEGYKGPIITLSGYAMREDIDKSLKMGAVGYITKPVDFSTFFERIGAFLKITEATPPGIYQHSGGPLQHYKIKDTISERLKNIFLQDLKSKIESISVILKEVELGVGRPLLKHIAHGFKGNAGHFGLSELENTATELDRAIKDEEPDQEIFAQSEILLGILKKIHKYNT
ncbi:MAG: response regulator [bacterium]|nr:response regulator [bacterium]